MRLAVTELPALISSRPELQRGCVVDTNALFAGAMPLDRLNEWAERVFRQLHSLQIPIFTNINIRSEFMDLQRRVLVPEGLVTLYDRSDKATMDSALKAQLKSLKTAKDEAAATEKLYKFNDQQMKKYRTLLGASAGPTGLNGWDAFCQSYLHPFIMGAWDEAVADLKVQFVGTRAIESREHFHRDPSWNEMTDVIGRFGIGSSDAMIVNFFLCSKFPLIVTGDEDVAYAVERLSNGSKFILVDDKQAKG
jgi:hypothetical protein